MKGIIFGDRCLLPTAYCLLPTVFCLLLSDSSRLWEGWWLEAGHKAERCWE
jgi:hypothetical protein